MNYAVRSWLSWVAGAALLGALIYLTPLYRVAASTIAYPAVLGNQWIVEPYARWRARSKSNVALVNELHALKDTYSDIKQQYAQLQAEHAYLKGIDEIREFAKQYAMPSMIAQIMVRSCGPDEQYYLVNRGSRDGVEKDMIALHKDAVVGKVDEVFTWYSKVRLITDTKCKIGAYLAPDRIKGVHEGCNDVAVTSLQHVDHMARVNVGDLVLTSGTGLLFPEGFTLGTVHSVAPDGLLQKISIHPACDLEEIEYCSLLHR